MRLGESGDLNFFENHFKEIFFYNYCTLSSFEWIAFDTKFEEIQVKVVCWLVSNGQKTYIGPKGKRL